MKLICFLYSSFFYIFSIPAFSYAQSSENSASSKEALEEDSEALYKAQLTDFYTWSQEDEKYVLKKSQFGFKMLIEKDSDAKDVVVDEFQVVDVVDTPKKKRYLSVFSPKEVHFEYGLEDSGKKLSVQSKLSGDQKKLSVYLSEKSKSSILNSLLSAYKVEEVSGSQIQSSSDYECRIQKAHLVCSIEYILKSM